NDLIAAGPGQPEPPGLDGLDVLGPLVDEGHVPSRLGETPADHAADRPRADDSDPLDHVIFLLRAVVKPRNCSSEEPGPRSLRACELPLRAVPMSVIRRHSS